MQTGENKRAGRPVKTGIRNRAPGAGSLAKHRAEARQLNTGRKAHCGPGHIHRNIALNPDGPDPDEGAKAAADPGPTERR